MGRAWLLALCVGISAACVVELDHRVACGDGFHDPEVEECDPGVEDSWEDACVDAGHPAGLSGCDPSSCTLTCSWCGDGFPDDGEECDPGRKATGMLASPTACAGSDPLGGPHTDTPYASGQSIRCLDDCTYDRTECSYCGDGIVEHGDAWLVSLPTQTPTIHYRPEVCDGEAVDMDALLDKLDCGPNGVANVECSHDCRDFEERAGGPPCCLRQGAPCPAESDAARCCHEFAHPEIEKHCTDQWVDPNSDRTSGGGPTCK